MFLGRECMTRYPILIKSSSNSLDTPIRGQRLVGISHVFIKSCTIPNTVYTIRQDVNDIIRIGDAATWYTATLTPGMYSISELLVELKTKFDATTIGTFTCTYNNQTLKVTFACTAQFRIDIALSTGAPVVGIGEDVALTTSHTCTGAVNLVSSERLYVQSRSLSSLLQPSMRFVNGTWLSTDTILSVPIDGEPGDVLVYVPESDNASYTSVEQGVLSRIDAAIVDDNGRLVDLQGVPWTLEVVVYAE